MNTPTEKDCQTLGELVAMHAEVIFEKCGYPQDFCVQAVGDVAVFGGMNRLLFHPVRGFYPDAAYCSPKFLAAFESLKLS